MAIEPPDHSFIFLMKMNPHCGRCCPEGIDPPHRTPHTGPGGAEVQTGRRYTGKLSDPSMKHMSCDRLGKNRGQRFIENMIEKHLY